MRSEARHPTNIGPLGQRLRRVMGIAGVLAAAGLVGLLYQLDASRWWRLGVFPLLWFGTLGLVQAQARTCVALAAQRTCDAELGPLTDADAEILARRGRALLRRATLLAGAVTLILMILR